MPVTGDDELRTLLAGVRTAAMVGASDRPDRPSFRVLHALQQHGWRVLPVNPGITGEHVGGEYVWRDLGQIGVPLDLVVVFRRPDQAGAAMDEAVAAGAPAVWLQLGIRDDAAAARAEAAGVTVVMDRCTAVELARLRVPPVA